MTFKLIGISGPARCGKDTAADHILNKRPAYQKTSFTDPLKAMLKVGLGLSDAQLYGSEKDVIDINYGCSPRGMLQTLGTEWGRELTNGDIWVTAMENHLNKIGGGTFVIPDIRFENEAAFVRKHGRMIHIEGRTTLDDTHISERGVDYGHYDFVITNDQSLEEYLSYVFGTLVLIEGDW